MVNRSHVHLLAEEKPHSQTPPLLAMKNAISALEFSSHKLHALPNHFNRTGGQKSGRKWTEDQPLKGRHCFGWRWRGRFRARKRGLRKDEPTRAAAPSSQTVTLHTKPQKQKKKEEVEKSRDIILIAIRIKASHIGSSSPQNKAKKELHSKN